MDTYGGTGLFRFPRINPYFYGEVKLEKTRPRERTNQEVGWVLKGSGLVDK